jgi:DNA-binding transcriptional ArsR family regulator
MDTPSTLEISEASDSSEPGETDVLTVLGALANPVRLEIVRQLSALAEPGELVCGEIRVPVSKSTTSHHLKTLAAAGIISEREAGTRKYVRLRRAELDRALPGLLVAVLDAEAPV